MRSTYCILLLLTLLSGCASTERSAEMAETRTAFPQHNGNAGLSLQDAIEQSAEKIAVELPSGSRVAIVDFESSSDSLSSYIVEELTGALFDRGLEVADRQNLDYVYRELEFQMSGDVSDESAQSIGKFLGAQLIITGNLTDLDGQFRFRTNAIHVETAIRSSIVRLDVRNDQAMERMVKALATQVVKTKATRYSVNENILPKTAGAFLDRGILFASRGEYDMAIMDFNEALELNPNLTAAYLLRARALIAKVSYMTNISEDFGKYTISRLNYSLLEEEVLIYDKAISDFTQAIRLDPNDPRTYAERGTTYNLKHDNDRALEDYNQAIRLDPTLVGAYICRGNAYSGKGDYDRAITDHTQAIRLDPNFAGAYNARGAAYYGKGDYDKAIADFTQAIRLDPNFVGAYNARGATNYSKGDYDRAIADYTQTIRLEPNYTVAYSNRGVAYYSKGEYDRAIADYTQAIRLDPNYAWAYTTRGASYYGKGDYDRAIADHTQAIRLDPNFAGAYSNRGNAFYGKGDYDRAIEDCTQAIKLDPNLKEPYTIRGNSYYDSGDYSKAITDYEAVLQLDPNDAYARQWLENARQRQSRSR